MLKDTTNWDKLYIYSKKMPVNIKMVSCLVPVQSNLGLRIKEHNANKRGKYELRIDFSFSFIEMSHEWHDL